MLLCCGRQFYAAEKIVLPKKDKLYRCLEYGHCPHCGGRVSRFIEQDKNYEIFVKDRRGIKAFNAYQKALKQRKDFLEQNGLTGSKSAENYYYGDFKKTNRVDENNLPVYVQLRKNFNNKSEELGEVVTHYFKL